MKGFTCCWGRLLGKSWQLSKRHTWEYAGGTDGYFGTEPALGASAACKTHVGVKPSQQGVSMAGVCVMMQVAQTAFFVVN